VVELKQLASDRVVSGVKIRVYNKGAGEPLLFLHGASAVPRWQPFFDALSDKFSLWVPEQPGFGQSENPDWIRSIGDLAMFYLDFMESQKLTGVHLVGHSLGGWLAAEIATRNDTRLKSLSLIAPIGVRIKGKPMADVFIWSPEEFVRNLFVNQKIADELLSHPPTDDEMTAQMQILFPVAKFAWQPRGFNPDLEKWLHRISVPTQILWGEGDKVISSDYADHWQKKILGSKSKIFANCGHIPHVENSAAVAAQIETFLSGI